MKLQRYAQLTADLENRSCRHLVEIGTWNGQRAKELSTAALKANREITYHGFDLFQDLTPEELEAELSKQPPSMAAVEADLASFRDRVARRGKLLPSRRRRFDFDLHRGYTTETLPTFVRADPSFNAEFIFIDGGHKVETIANDWQWCSQIVAPDGVIYLDDYYGSPELTAQFGCNQLVEQLRAGSEWVVEVLDAIDTFPDIGSIQIVRVSPARA